MSQLEEAIIEGVSEAAKKYDEMSGGWWLSHAPESFLQMEIATKIYETGFNLFVDASYNKILDDIGRIRGRPANGGSKRPDICVFSKASRTIKALIEVKRASNLFSVNLDKSKLSSLMRLKTGPKYCYVVAYSEANGNSYKKTLEERFLAWEDKEWYCCHSYIDERQDDDGYGWGYCVLKLGK